MHPSEAQAQLASDRAVIHGYLPYMRKEIEDLKRARENYVFTQMASNTLTPDAALLAWQEIAILKRILQHFEQKASIPVS